MEYSIISAEDLKELERLVNERLKEGWVVSGSLLLYHHITYNDGKKNIFIQPLVYENRGQDLLQKTRELVWSAR